MVEQDLLKIIAPTDDEITRLPAGVTIVSLVSSAFDPELVAELADRPIPAPPMGAVPRLSRAQSMDALSSMADIVGYRAVVGAADKFGRFFTCQVTAAGKFPPAKVLIAGADVARAASVRSCVEPIPNKRGRRCALQQVLPYRPGFP